MVTQIFYLMGGLVFLALGADWLVRGSSRLARAGGISALTVGLTVVALGTSSPELFVNVRSSLAGQSNIVMGNTVGSNLFNILVILGICAVIMPLKTSHKLNTRDVPIMIVSALLLFIVSLDHRISKFEGLLLILGIIAYLKSCFYYAQKERTENKRLEEMAGDSKIRELRKPTVVVQNIGLIVTGLILLMFGSQWLVDSSVFFAHHFGISDLVIALTIIAAGTSLPEFATSIVAALKKEREIAIGNLIGSNIFNVLAIMGTAASISPKGVEIHPNALSVDIPFMIMISVLCFPFLKTQMTVSRIEGLTLVILYVGYTVYLLQRPLVF